MGQQIQLWVSRTGLIIAGVGEARPSAMCYSQPGRANLYPKSSEGFGRIFYFDIKFPSSSKDTGVCPHTCFEADL